MCRVPVISLYVDFSYLGPGTFVVYRARGRAWCVFFGFRASRAFMVFVLWLGFRRFAGFPGSVKAYPVVNAEPRALGLHRALGFCPPNF